jgi:hypothetical protein
VRKHLGVPALAKTTGSSTQQLLRAASVARMIWEFHQTYHAGRPYSGPQREVQYLLPLPPNGPRNRRPGKELHADAPRGASPDLDRRGAVTAGRRPC